MKKNLIIILLILFSISFISAETYKSNLLMQKLEDSADSDYYLIQYDNYEELFNQNDELVKSRIIENSSNNGVAVESIQIVDYLNSIKESYVYNNSFLIEYSYSSEVESLVCTYSYDDNGSLIFTSIFDGIDITVECYIRDSFSGELLGTKILDTYIWNGDNYLLDNETIYTEVADGVILEDTFSVQGENIVFEKNYVKQVYSSDGLLLEERGSNYYTTYNYDGRLLIESTTIAGSEKVESYFKNGKLTENHIFNNDDLIEITFYYDTGMVRQLFSNNEAIAEIQYDRSNMKVVEVRYLN